MLTCPECWEPVEALHNWLTTSVCAECLEHFENEAAGRAEEQRQALEQDGSELDPEDREKTLAQNGLDDLVVYLNYRRVTATAERAEGVTISFERLEEVLSSLAGLKSYMLEFDPEDLNLEDLDDG